MQKNTFHCHIKATINERDLPKNLRKNLETCRFFLSNQDMLSNHARFCETWVSGRTNRRGFLLKRLDWKPLKHDRKPMKHDRKLENPSCNCLQQAENLPKQAKTCEKLENLARLTRWARWTVKTDAAWLKRARWTVSVRPYRVGPPAVSCYVLLIYIL